VAPRQSLSFSSPAVTIDATRPASATQSGLQPRWPAALSMRLRHQNSSTPASANSTLPAASGFRSACFTCCAWRDRRQQRRHPSGSAVAGGGAGRTLFRLSTVGGADLRLVSVDLCGAAFCVAAQRGVAEAPAIVDRSVAAVPDLWAIGWRCTVAISLGDGARSAREGDFFASGGGFADVFSADLIGYLVPTRLHPLWGGWVAALPFPNDKGQHIFLGYSAMLLSVLGLWDSWRGDNRALAWLWGGSLLIFFLLTLGPTVRWAGADTGDHPAPLPWSASYLFQRQPLSQPLQRHADAGRRGAGGLGWSGCWKELHVARRAQRGERWQLQP
jgi:hypothetical protein